MENGDFWKSMIASLIRKLMVAVGAYLLNKGWVNSELAQGMATETFAYYLAGFILFIGALLGQYMKHRFNKLTLEKAVEAPSGTPLGVIKTEVLNNEKLVTSL